MSSPILGERGLFDFFTTSPEPSIDSLFDLNFDSLHKSGDSNSYEPSNFFDEWSSASSSRVIGPFDSTPSSALSAPYKSNLFLRAGPWKQQEADSVPKSQKLLHKFRRDDTAISNSELLTLEGKAPRDSVTPPPSSKLLSPQPHAPLSRLQPSSPKSETRTRRKGKLEKLTPLSKNGKSNTMHPSSYYTSRQSPVDEAFQQVTDQSYYNVKASIQLQSEDDERFEENQRLSLKPEECQTAISPHTDIINPTDTNSYLCSPFTQSSTNWSQQASDDFSLSPPRAWSGDDAVASTIYGTEHFEGSSHTQSMAGFDRCLVPSGLGISCDVFGDSFQNGCGHVHLDPVSDQNVEEAMSDSSDCSPTVQRTSTHRKSASSLTSLSTPTKRCRSSRQSKTPRTPRTPKTPKTPTKSGGNSGGFVNFTPNDSLKILTGVAPSGSSKTKARREREAIERRKRLSEAAAKAVIEAGGDLNELLREGLFLGESTENSYYG